MSYRRSLPKAFERFVLMGNRYGGDRICSVPARRMRGSETTSPLPSIVHGSSFKACGTVFLHEGQGAHDFDLHAVEEGGHERGKLSDGGRSWMHPIELDLVIALFRLGLPSSLGRPLALLLFIIVIVLNLDAQRQQIDGIPLRAPDEGMPRSGARQQRRR